MSGKRSLKKQQKRAESAFAELEEMIRRGADDRFLARAAELFPDPSVSPFGTRWAEVADRALRQSLARADFNRLESLLRSLRRTSRPRPLAAMAEAVLDLTAGRRAAARAKLAAASLEGHPAPDLLQALQSLQTLAGDELPDDPYLRAAEDFLRACRRLDDRAELARSLYALRGAAPVAEGEPRRLLLGLIESAERCLGLLNDLAALNGDLVGRADGAPRASEAVLAWLRGTGPARAVALAAAQTHGTAGTPLLATLQHAVRSRWRAVLEWVMEQEGTAGLAALCIAEPKLLLADVELSGGVQEGLASLRKRAQAEQLASGHRYGALADLLRSRSRTVSAEDDLAALWGLELWAHSRSARDEDEEDDGFFHESRPHRTLMRLQEMAAEIGTRFAPEHRAEVAGVLRGELFLVCPHIRFCEHTAGAALSLLEHEPAGAGQTGLFIAGVAGAVNSGDRRALHALQDRLILRGQARGQARGQVPAGDRADQDILRSLMIGIAQERPDEVAKILEIVRPLFAADRWPETAALVAEEMSRSFAAFVCQVSLETPDDGELAPMFGEIRRDLALLRPALAETPGLAAMELLLDCWLPGRRAAEKSLATFLAVARDLAIPLTAWRVIEKVAVPWAPQGIRTAFDGLTRAVIERLDDRWQLWCDDVPLLAKAADGGSLLLLERKLRQLLTAKETSPEGRTVLERTLHVIQQPRKGMRRKRTTRFARRRAAAL